MKTCTYNEVLQLAGDLLSRAGSAERQPVAEATMLRLFFAAQLPDLWNREAWPELCDHLEEVALDAANCFSLREGEADEIGDVLAVVVGGDPRLTTNLERLPREQLSRLENRMNVLTAVEGALWVDWQTPCPDLLNDDFIIAAVVVGTPSATTIALALPLYELPARFKLALAALGAAHLIANEDPAMSGVLRGVAEADLAKQATRLVRPWWRR